MTRAGLVVLADDLTGACECALAAVEAGGRALTHLGTPSIRDDGAWDLVAIDLDARDGAPITLPPDLGGREPVLKIDSTLRGPLPALVAQFARATGAELLVVAPALPARGRVTRGGFQHVLGTADAPIDVRERLGSCGVETVVLDGEDDRDLDAGVAWGDATGRRIGWVGSAGLVSALARARFGRPAVPAAPDPGGAVLVIVGSRTAETAEQLGTLASRSDVDVYALAGADPGQVARTLAGGRHAVVRDGAPPALAALAGAVARRGSARRLLLTGGATARAVCDALGIRALQVVGAAADGTPVARTLDGMRTVATKAGRFGPSDALSVAVDRLAGARA